MSYLPDMFTCCACLTCLTLLTYRLSFKEDIMKELDWMDEMTKKRAIQKLDEMDQVTLIGKIRLG